MADLLRALEKKYEGDIAVHTANIQVYQENPSGIGEHPEIVQALDAEVSKLRKEATYAGDHDAYKAPKVIDNSSKPKPVERITNWDDV